VKGFQELDSVRVAKLLSLTRPFSSSEGVGRAPAVGDTGAVVMAYENPRGYTVECISPDGMTVWLADFEPDELEAE
jgi:hypothetical protein